MLLLLSFVKVLLKFELRFGFIVITLLHLYQQFEIITIKTEPRCDNRGINKMKDPRIFVTDYASYNNGTQFEFGHWVDLKDFSDANELMEYIKDHFAEADEKSPLDTPREELMITDFEGFPEILYSESMGFEQFDKIYRLIDWMEQNGLETLENEGSNLLDFWNEYCSETSSDDHIYTFDDETLSMLFGDDPMKAFMAGVNAEINFSHDYLTFDGYGHIISLDDPSYHIDETVLIDYILENLI